jgi:2-isopropylmalate synthase
VSEPHGRQADGGTGRRLRIIDCTLREGTQTPGVTFSSEQSAEIAGLLAATGVDMIECGHAAISLAERERVKATIAASGDVPVLVHARACRGDIDAVIETGASWVGVFLGCNGYTRLSRVVGASTDDLLTMIANAVGYAVERGLHVRFTAEDASRTEMATLERAYGAAVAAGADRITFADTVGTLEPGQVKAVAGRLRDCFPGTDLEFHLHDDRRLAEANALAAVDGGADWISCSINGLGERAGVTDTTVLLVNLHHRGDRALGDVQALRRASEVVSAFSRIPLDPLYPVFGRHAFTHVARLHQRAVEIDPMAYSWIDPAVLGRRPTLSSAARWALDDLVIEPEVRSATELRYHRHGPGDRYLLIDERKLDRCGMYCIARRIPGGDPGKGHVDAHRHKVDSLFAFLGSADGLTGLRVQVTVGDEERVLDSPCSVFIPAGVRHSYRVLGGSGLYLNVVLAGTYERSLLE